MPIAKTAGPSPASATRSHAPSSTQRRRIAPRGQEDENVDIASPTPTRPLKTQTSAQALTEHVLNNSPGRTPKARGPPKAPRVDRNDGLRHMTEAEVSARACPGTIQNATHRVLTHCLPARSHPDGRLVLL